MSKNILIIIIVLIVLGGISAGAYFFLKPECPASCDDANPCTREYCSKETNYKCKIENIPNCCGNETCEAEETYETCPVDCPNCDDNNECTEDSYDYHAQQCINAPILTAVCCGNTVCETSETYINCPRDCPNCDDDNECTEDSYDYHQQKCLNEIIEPCCGNGICDKSAETYSNCSEDCPNCDDGNKLTSDSFNYATQKCESVVAYYFVDDFEQGIQNWSYGSTPEDPTASWSTKTEGSNTVFRGIGHNWSSLKGKEWDNYILRVKFKVVRGTIHFNYRLTEEEEPERYFVSVDNKTLSLSKQRGKTFDTLTEPSVNITLTTGWHNLEIRGYGNIINVYLDNKLLVKYKDTNNPLLSGGIGFETLQDSEFLLDDVEIKIVAQGDVVYP